jgi:hypothetical protein
MTGKPDFQESAEGELAGIRISPIIDLTEKPTQLALRIAFRAPDGDMLRATFPRGRIPAEVEFQLPRIPPALADVTRAHVRSPFAICCNAALTARIKSGSIAFTIAAASIERLRRETSTPGSAQTLPWSISTGI